MKILETERLYLREFILEDAEQMYHLNNDEEVLRFTGDIPFSSVEHAKDFLIKYDHYKKYGFGRWAVLHKKNQEFLGWCGLKYSPDSEEYDIGFRFFKTQWNKGYATESAKACLALGFQKFQLKVILGRAMKVNIRSIRVLEKIGLTYVRTFNFDGEKGVIYEIKNI